ncbi:MAG: apolipoprotein N-acyltransferase [Planctomycetes bacterium]|nr:apolipoprotein N-acyltransferase [Planctomycetota bacterium]
MGFLCWIAFVPLLAYIHAEPNLKKIFLHSWLAGALFYFAAMFWLRNVTWAGLFISSFAPTGIHFALFALIYKKLFQPRKKWARVIGVPVCWTAVEYLSTLWITAFPWFLTGYSQFYFKPFIQICDMVGVQGLSLLIMLANAVLVEIVLYRKTPAPEEENKTDRISWPGRLKAGFNANRLYLAVPVLLVVLSTIYGIMRLNALQIVRGPKIGIVQGNIPQSVKDTNLSINDVFNIHNRHLELSKELLPQKPDLIVWAETMYMFPIGRHRENEEHLKNTAAKELRLPILFGANTVEKAPRGRERYYNSAYYYDPSAGELQRYDKINLVLVSEYLPLKDDFPSIEEFVLKFTELKQLPGLTPGREQRVFALPYNDRKDNAKFGVLICFESIFPGLARQLMDKGADFIITISNDGWFRDSCELEQISQITAFRAIENRTGIARATNTGISAFFLPDGSFETLSQNGRIKEFAGSMCKTVALAKGRTIYASFGYTLPFLCLAVITVLLAKIVFKFLLTLFKIKLLS